MSRKRPTDAMKFENEIVSLRLPAAEREVLLTSSHIAETGCSDSNAKPRCRSSSSSKLKFTGCFAGALRTRSTNAGEDQRSGRQRL